MSSLLDNVSDTVKSTARTLSDKIHLTASIGRVKMMISKEDKSLQKELAALGTACYEQHKNPQAETSYSAYFEKIERMQSRMVALQMKLHELYTQRAEGKKDGDVPAPGETVQPEPGRVGSLAFDQRAESVASGKTEEPAGDSSAKPEEESVEPEEGPVGEAETARESSAQPKVMVMEEVEESPEAEQIREETINQLVDVVSEEMGSEENEMEISEDLDQEIVSRNAGQDDSEQE